MSCLKLFKMNDSETTCEIFTRFADSVNDLKALNKKISSLEFGQRDRLLFSQELRTKGCCHPRS